jgi:deoxyhypusine synthase
MNVRNLIEENYLHFNAGELRDALRALEIHIEKGNKIFITLSGAMSTARIGRLLAPAIQKGLIGGICCTGANLEEDVFNAIEGHRYKQVDWRSLSPSDEEELVKDGWNRVTDTCIPVFVPGWSDSTTGNMFTASVKKGEIKTGYNAVVSDAEQFAILANWYESQITESGESPAFLQIGGGIAGDWPICVVPSLRQDENKDVPHWGYFCQVCDAPASYGGYSGAPPNEKITWDKVSSQTPRFAIQSDASIVLPLILDYLLTK